MSTRPVTDLVEADLPITPMLDMSFQLLSFFIMTFHPSPTEGQIALALPPAEGPGPSERFEINIEKPAHHIVRILADDQGKITDITLRTDTVIDEGRSLGADVAVLMKELKAITSDEQKRREKETARGNAAPPPPKLTFEMSNKLVQAYVVQVFDVAVQAGFTDVATVPIDRARR